MKKQNWRQKKTAMNLRKDTMVVREEKSIPRWLNKKVYEKRKKNLRHSRLKKHEPQTKKSWSRKASKQRKRQKMESNFFYRHK